MQNSNFVNMIIPTILMKQKQKPYNINYKFLNQFYNKQFANKICNYKKKTKNSIFFENANIQSYNEKKN